MSDPNFNNVEGVVPDPLPAEPVESTPDAEEAAEPVDASPEVAPEAEPEHPVAEAIADAVEEIQNPTGAVTEEPDLPGDEVDDDEPAQFPESEIPEGPVEVPDGEDADGSVGNGGMK